MLPNALQNGTLQHFHPFCATFSAFFCIFASVEQVLTILFTLLLALPSAVQAQSDFDILDMRSGLPESRIRALCQMPDGRMAIATAGTITIYDGTRFAAYHLRPEQEYPLSDYHGLRQLTCDSTGLVWLRNDGHLYVVDARHQHVIANVDSLLKERRLTARQVSAWPDSNNRKKTEYFQTVSRLTSDEISALVRDSYGGLWVGLKESGIMYSNPARKRQFQTTSDAFPYEALYPFCSPRASQLSSKYAASATNCTLDGRTLTYTYLGTRNGVMIIDRKDRLVATIDERDGLSTNNVVALLSDRHGGIWAATANGLTHIFQTGRDSFDIVNYGLLDGIDTQGREFRTCQMHIDASGLITVGFAGGTVVFHPDSVTAPRYTFHFPRVTALDKPQELSISEHQNLGWLTAVLILILCSIVFVVWYRKKRLVVQPSGGEKTSDYKNYMTQNLTTMSQDIAKQVAEKGISSSDLEFLERLKAVVEQHVGDEDFSVQSLSEMMAMDRTVLYRRMQALTGMPPSVYVKNIRLNVARRLLSNTDLPVSDIAAKTGFATTKYFSAAFKDAFGMTPNEFRR